MKPCTFEAIKLIHDGVRTLAQIERNGIRIDVPYLKKAIKRTEKRCEELEEEIKSDPIYDCWKGRYRQKTNLGSKKQLETIIFEELGKDYERSGRTTDSGEYSADEAAFEKVKIPFVKKYFEREKLLKANGTYLKGILREIVGEIARPIIDLHTAITYRSSAQRFNIMNQPVRFFEVAKIIRQCFVAPDDYRIGEIDYGGIEVCGSCCYHKDPKMIKYVKNPASNMHTDMSVTIFKLAKDQVGKRVRNTTKNGFVFPEFYGSWYEDCATSMWDTMEILELKIGPNEEGCSLRKHLKKKGIKTLEQFIEHCKTAEKEMWDARFSVYRDWKWEWWEQYVERGWFPFLTGFVSRGLYNKKQVCNSPIQGSSFHMLLWSLCRLQEWMNKKKLKSKLIAEIHDSILGYWHKKEMDYIFEKAHQIMTVDILKHWDWICVPLTIEAEVAPLGGSWFDKQKYEIKV